MPRGGLSTYRHSLTALGAAVPLISAYPFIGARAQSAVYDGLACAAVLASALRARRSASGGGRWVWVLITATLALWCAGDVTSDLGSASFASSADALYLAGYPVLVAALLLLGRRLVGTPERGALLDATIVGVAFSIVGWVGIGNRYLAVDQHGVWVSTTTLLYAFGDVLLISLLAHVLIARKRITPTLAFLAVGIGFQLIADVGYSIDNTNYRVGGLLDLGWMLAYVWFAAAALLPVEDAGETAVRTARHNRLRLVLLGAALAIAPIALLSGSLDQDDRLAVGIGVALLWMLVLISAALSYRSAERLQRELEAEHELLARSEERLRLIFEHSPLSISVTDDRRQLIELNPEALAVTGYTEEEFRSLGIRGVTHPDDVDLDAGLFQELVEGKRDSFKSLKRFVRKDGGIIWGRVSYSVARAADGSVRFAIGMIEDVTQQRSAEEERDAAFEAMRASEDRFRAAFEAGGIGMVITSPKAEIVRANRAFCEITGYTEEELVGRSALEITDPEDVETSRSYLSQTHDPDLRSQSFDKRYVRKDGTSVWVRLTVAVIRDRDGAPLFNVTHVQDLTAQRALEGARDRAAQELRESEARSWRLLSKTLELLFVIDQDGRFAWVNPATEAQLGYEAGELLGGSRLDLIHPDDVEMVEEAIEDKLAGGRIDVQPIVSRIRHKDGSWRTIETRGINLLDDPVVHGILVSARDITDRVEMERERERLELERRVAQRLEAVGQLAAGIAHEINTPIQFVGDSVRFLEESYADLDVLRARHRDLLLEHGLAEQVLEAEEEADLAYLCERVPSAFHRITDGVERVTTIVRAMQRFAHAPRAERAPANLDEALGATATVSRSEYKYVADLELDLGELPPVLCNVGDLNQVFLNLIVNAAHAIADRVGDSGERGTIVVRSRVEPDMGNVLVEVVDDGCGIDPDARERIFEPFFTTKDVGRGTGQGLAISRSIVEQHGGSITFSSELGKGTTFSVRIPLQCGDVEAEAA